MNDVALGVLIRPFTALILFGTAYFLGIAILKRIPEGRLKRVLSRRYEVVPETVSPRTQRWATIILVVIATWIVCVQVLKATGRLS